MLRYLLLPLLSFSLFASLLSTPKEPVPLNQSFSIKSTAKSFDESIGYTHRKLLNCTPKLEANYRVVSGQELLVLPKRSLPSSTTFSCQYKEEKFTFKTEEFNVTSSHYFEREKALRLEFNDGIEKASIKKGIHLYRVNKLTKTALNYSVSQENPKILLLKINEKIGQDKLTLELTKELKTLKGTTLKERLIKHYHESHPTVSLDTNKKSLQLTNDPVMVALENGEFALRIFVDDDLISNAKSFIEIEGVENIKLSNSNYLNYDLRQKFNIHDAYYYYDVTSKELKANKHYNVTLKKGLQIYNRELKEDLVYQLKTGDRAKSILFDEEKPYISNRGELSFLTVNVEHATLVVERMLNENLRYFMNFNQAKIEQIDEYSEEIFTKKLLLENKKNVVTKQKFRLSDLSKGKLPVGVYKISLHYKEKVGEKENEKVSSKILFLSNLGISATIGKTEACRSALDRWLSQKVEEFNVLYLDWELTEEEQSRCIYKLARGMNLTGPPDGLDYLRMDTPLMQAIPQLKAC